MKTMISLIFTMSISIASMAQIYLPNYADTTSRGVIYSFGEVVNLDVYFNTHPNQPTACMLSNNRGELKIITTLERYTKTLLLCIDYSRDTLTGQLFVRSVQLGVIFPAESLVPTGEEARFFRVRYGEWISALFLTDSSDLMFYDVTTHALNSYYKSMKPLIRFGNDCLQKKYIAEQKDACMVGLEDSSDERFLEDLDRIFEKLK